MKEKTLRELLANRGGYHTYVATLGKNGNGGALSAVYDILEADEKDGHLDDYKPVEFELEELEKHVRDATGYTESDLEDLGPENEWVAFDCDHTDENGYLTGSRSRIYVNLSV